MPNNPYINQMNIQGTLYDLWDQRWTPDNHDNISFTAPSTVTIVAPEGVTIGPSQYGMTVWDDGSVTVASSSMTVDGDEVATQPWVLEQLSDIAIQGGMVFKGVINNNSEVPATHEAGWVYLVQTAGTYAGQVCEAGDLLVCIQDGTSANNSHWTAVQNNVSLDNVSHYKGAIDDQFDIDLSEGVFKGDFWSVYDSNGFDFLGVHLGANSLLLCIRDLGDVPEGHTIDEYENRTYFAAISPEISNKEILAGTGLSLSSTTSSITFNHANSITAGAFGPSASASALSFALPYVQYDAQGHISSVASFTHTIPTFMPATSSSAGQAGVLPAMSSMTSEQETWVLYANGTWGPQLGSGDEGYTLPLAADGTRGGLQVGYATDRTSGYFAVQLQSEKAYVAIPTFTGATSQADGAQGLVPQSFASASTAFLRADGEWANVAYVSSNILYM